VTRLACLALASAAASAAGFPEPYNSERDTNSAPMPPAAAAAAFSTPPGFHVTAFAAEPDVQNPIAMAWDGRGRLWVAENYTYAEQPKRFDLGLRDRVLIFEPGPDGRFRSRRVFTDDVQVLTGIEVGAGGVWLMCPPRLLFIPLDASGDKPAGPPVTVLDGFVPVPESHHNFANGLRFGPDGWLYGRCGASCPADVGAPGAPAAERIPMRGGMWRYDIKRKVFEPLTSGTTNPWGHDWNEYGDLFFINTVNGHLWQGVPGAHFVRSHTIDPNPRVYEVIDQYADHWHFDTTQGWVKSRDGAANTYGGGHAHVGMMIYQGDNWPAEFRGRLFTWNFHGRRANEEILERSGSGYVGRHGGDFFASSDSWFRGMEWSVGPDGAAFALDWSDTGECHDSTGVHRTSGRIYKVAYGAPRDPGAFNVEALSDEALVQWTLSENAWYVRRAEIEWARRADTKEPHLAAAAALRRESLAGKNPVHRINALNAMKALGKLDSKSLTDLLQDADDHIRSSAIRMLVDDLPIDTPLSRRPPGRDTRPAPGLVTTLAAAAKRETSALVRLSLISALQRLPAADRLAVAKPLAARDEDAADHSIPLMLWYGLIPVADADPQGLAALAIETRLPATRRCIARRLAEDLATRPEPVENLLRGAAANTPAWTADILRGLAEGLAGWRKAPKPKGWSEFAALASADGDEAVRARVVELNALFGDGRALDELRHLAGDRSASLAIRKSALQALIEARPADLHDLCERYSGERFLNSVAVHGLALFDDPAIGARLVRDYGAFHPTERAAVMDVLASRPAYAGALLEGVAAGRIPKADLTPFHARQIRSFGDPALTRRLAEAWGEVRDSSAEKRAFINTLKTTLTPATLAAADRSEGRRVFQVTCAPCHRLYGDGGNLGPDLTGAGRSNLDYLLENIVDPSAIVAADYRMTIVTMKDGRVLNGILAARTERTLTVRTINETAALDRSDIQEVKESRDSVMPEGLLESLPPDKLRNLIAYLSGGAQAPLPEVER
jgi:putative membrane-bound dehydrogenase-like protein